MNILESSKQLRKIQLSGGSTFIVSLPKSWVDDLKVNVGDEVTIIKNANRSLTLFPNPNFEEESKKQAVITIVQKNSPEVIKRKIIATYLAGYHSIIIRSKGVKIQSEYVRMIRELVRSSMIGTEIVESSSEEIQIQVLTRLPELSFETALKRMYLMASTMHKDAIYALTEVSEEDAEEVIRTDDEVDRFSLYMRRNLTLAVQNSSLLHDMKLEKPSDCLGYRAVIARIERIADHAGLIAKRVKFLESKIEPSTMNKIEKISDDSLVVFEKAIIALNKKDYELAEQTLEEIQKVISKEKDLMSKLKDSTKNSTVLRFVLEDIRRVAEYSNDIAEVAIDANIENVISQK